MWCGRRFAVTVRLACALLLALLMTTPAGAQSPSPVGVWLHANGRIQVAVAPCGDRLCGRIIWFRWPNDAQGVPLVDLKNPDPALRARPLLGLTVLSDLRLVAEGEWKGEIYNPDDGETYQVLVSLPDGRTLRTRAYVVLPLLGETQFWKRMQ